MTFGAGDAPRSRGHRGMHHCGIWHDDAIDDDRWCRDGDDEEDEPDDQAGTGKGSHGGRGGKGKHVGGDSGKETNTEVEVPAAPPSQEVTEATEVPR